MLDTDVKASFGGDYSQPIAMVNFVNLTMPPEVSRVLTENISEILLNQFGVSPDRMYIYFQEVTPLHLFAWNKQTFDEIVGGDSVADLERKVSQT